MQILIQELFEAIQAIGVDGLWIAGVVLVLVAFAKQFKFKPGHPLAGEQVIIGNGLLWLGFGLGFGLTILAHLYNNAPPVGEGWYAWFRYVFIAVIYGALIGVVPSGVYELLLKKPSE